MKSVSLACIAFAALSVGACQAKPAADAPASSRPFAVTELATFDEPWAMAFLPSGDLLVTEKAGKLKWKSSETVREVAGTPRVEYAGQGGFGDIALAPDYATSGMVYLSWVEDAGNGQSQGLSGAVIGRAKLVLDGQPRLEGLNIIWRQTAVNSEGHFSHRILFSPDGRYLFVTSGERQHKTPAQDLSVNLGKVLRLLPDGTPAPGNPFAGKGGKSDEIWSYGHRNLYGLKFDADGRLWEHEMGPQGGDEVNLIVAGKNYGWPIVSNGSDYDDTDIPDHPTRPEFEAPKVWWNPSVSPSSLVIYSGDKFPQWKGDMLIGTLSGMSLIRVDLDGDKAVKAERWPMDNRIREVEQGPDGNLYLLEDGSDGRLLKLTPAA